MRIGKDELDMAWQNCLTGITILFFKGRRFLKSAYQYIPYTVKPFAETIKYIKR